MSWMSRILIGIGVLVTALPFVLFLYGSIRTWSAHDWPVAEGRVAASRVETITSTDSDGETSTSYEVVVTYDYAVEGRRYRSERLYLNAHEIFSYPEDAQAELRTYPVGTALDVSYDPDDPGDAAVFIEGPTPWIFLLIVFGLGFLAAGYFLHRMDGPMRRRAGR